MGKRCLVVACDMPFPPNYGGAVGVYNHLVNLNKLSITVDLLCTPWQMQNHYDTQNLISKLFVFPRELSHELFYRLFTPFQVTTRNKNVMKNLDIIVESYRYELRRPEIILVEGLYVAEIGIVLAKRLGAKCILRANNIESDFYFQMARSSGGIKKLFYYSEALRFRLYEPQLTRRFDTILAVSKEESSRLQGMAPNARVVWEPPYVRIPEELKRHDDGHTMLYVGALDRGPNIHGLRWFIKHVWSKKSVRDVARFVVVGRNPDYAFKQLCLENGIELHSSVPDVIPYYQAASLVVNPIFLGAGVNIKTIECIGLGIPLITTNIGIRGTGLNSSEHVYVADTWKNFVESIIEIIKQPEHAMGKAQNARRYVNNEFNSLERLAEVFSIA